MHPVRSAGNHFQFRMRNHLLHLIRNIRMHQKTRIPEQQKRRACNISKPVSGTRPCRNRTRTCPESLRMPRCNHAQRL